MTDNSTETLEKTENQSLCPDADKETPKDSVEEKLFTQSQLEALISERLKRERKNNEALLPVKELLSSLQSKGILTSKAYSGLCDELCRRLSPQNEGVENSAAPMSEKSDENADSKTNVKVEVTESDRSENVPCQENHIGGEESPKASEIDASAQNAAKPLTVSLGDITQIREMFPDANIENVLCDKTFSIFAQGRNGNLASIYRDDRNFSDLFSLKEQTDVKKNQENRLASTAFSSYAGSVGNDYSAGLSKQQMEIAKQAGMSYREYSEMLEAIPHGLRSKRG